jgi:hypothetical protein
VVSNTSYGEHVIRHELEMTAVWLNTSQRTDPSEGADGTVSSWTELVRRALGRDRGSSMTARDWDHR